MLRATWSGLGLGGGADLEPHLYHKGWTLNARALTLALTLSSISITKSAVMTKLSWSRTSLSTEVGSRRGTSSARQTDDTMIKMMMKVSKAQ